MQVIIKCSLIIVDYFDVTLNLIDGTCRHFHNPNGEKLTCMSNLTIKKRLSYLSSTKKIIKNSKDYLEERLRKCGYNKILN